MAGLLNNLSIKTEVTEEGEAEGLEAALGIEVDRDGKNDGAGEGKEEGTGTL